MRIVSKGGLWKEEAEQLEKELIAKGYKVKKTSYDEGHHYTVSWE